MPKGDRLKLKADPDDGTTPIANLLLEAVAMAKLSGLQKGAIIYLWRRTYGWVENGQRLKECKIPLPEWQNALNSTKPRVSASLSELVSKGIIKRRTTDIWGGYYYSINTLVSEWNGNCINISKLSETVIADNSPVTENGTVTQNDNGSNFGEQLPKTEQLPKMATITDNNNSYQEQNGTVTQNDNPNSVPPESPLPLNNPLSPLPPTSFEININKRGDVKKLTSLFGVKLKEVFARLDKLRGYKPPKRSAEAAAILRMLKKKYTPDQIINTWEKLKHDTFYSKKELFMMTVESQIGAIVNGTHSGDNQGNGNAETNTQKDQPNKYLGGKYGHLVKH